MFNPLGRRTLVMQAVLLGCMFTACVGARRPQAQADAIAFSHVTVIPMDREGMLEDYTVIVRGDRISHLGPAGEVRIPSGAVIIPGEGKFLMPGLVDMHVHLEDEEDALLLFVANGVTTVRNMWGKPQHLQWRTQIEAGDRLGPTIYTTGPITDGDPPMWEGSAIVATADAAERELLAQREAGYDGMKVMTNLLPEVYEAILVASRKHHFPVYGHVQTRVGYRQALGAGQRTFEHMFDFVYALLPEDSALRERIIDAWEHRSEPAESWKAIGIDPYREALTDRIRSIAARAAAADAWFCPTLIATQGFHIDSSDAEARRRRPYNRYVPPERLGLWQAADEFQLSQFADPELDQLAVEIGRRSVEALHRAGARLLAGTDTHPDLAFLVPGFSLHEELRNLVRAGLSPYQTLRAATVEPAAALGASGEFGAVATGLRADLLLLDVNPLMGVERAADRVGVMIRGRWFPESDLRARLDRLATAYSRQGTESPPEHEQ